MDLNVNLSPTELNQITEQVTAQVTENLVSELRKIEVTNLRKYAFRVSEVAGLIGYSQSAVRTFIHKGRTDRQGKLRYLKVLEITGGDYRILPKDLDQFLSHF